MQKIKSASSGLIAAGGMTIVSLVLLVYTSYRTVHLIQSTLPPESWGLAFFALGAFDVGLLLWIGLHTWHATGDEQRSISITMIWVDIAGVAITFIADTILQSATNGLTGKLETGWVIAALLLTGAVILANIVGFIFYHLSAPKHRERVREERLRAAIEAKADEMIENQLEVLASQLAPKIAADKMRRMGAQYTAGLGHMPQLPSGASAKQVSAPAPRKPKPAPTAAYEVPNPATNYRVEPNGTPGGRPSRFRRKDGRNGQPASAPVYYQPEPEPSAEEVAARYSVGNQPLGYEAGSLAQGEVIEQEEGVDQGSDFLPQHPPQPNRPILWRSRDGVQEL